MSANDVNILMYHSISDGSGPTCIAPAIFVRQMAVIQECGFQVIALSELADWCRGERELSPRSLVLTFDDGYEDFASVAWPELKQRGWSATVFLPTGRVGGEADWDQGADHRPLMSWDTIAELAREGVDFGGHTIGHVDLTTLPRSVAQVEIVESKRQIEDHVGRPAACFAAPFGRTSADVRSEIGRHYQLAVGTTMARAKRTSNPHDLPRIEMWYYRNITRWRTYLQGGGQAHFQLRRALRRARTMLTTLKA